MTTPPPTPTSALAALVEAREKIAKAERVVSDLCKYEGEPGYRRWIMSIPARPDYDPDLVISDALRAADAILAALPSLDGMVLVPQAVVMTAASIFESDARHDREKATRDRVPELIQLAEHNEAIAARLRACLGDKP